MRSSRLLLLVFALACATGFALTFVVALHTKRGLSLDRSGFERVTGDSSVQVATAGEHILRTIDIATLALALGGIALVAIARRDIARAVASTAIVCMSVGSAEVLKPHLARLGAVPAGRPPIFPSGHTAVAVSVGLALVLASPPVLRLTVALAASAYSAAIAFSVVALGWHYPSDAFASFLLCGFWACVIATALPGVRPRTHVSTRGLVAAVVAVATGLAFAAVIAFHHPVAVATARSRPVLLMLAAIYGLISLLLFTAFAPLVGDSSSTNRVPAGDVEHVA
ncbi:MAG TPA: phosphatase PAP2 family protein [Gaiellaceae bacterium]|nr:phosphatase PAP2 family protein [Gaiellaceae bacterium]